MPSLVKAERKTLDERGTGPSAAKRPTAALHRQRELASTEARITSRSFSGFRRQTWHQPMSGSTGSMGSAGDGAGSMHVPMSFLSSSPPFFADLNAAALV